MADQTQTITLPTLPQVRERLEKAGWTLRWPEFKTSHPERWVSPVADCEVILYHGKAPSICPMADESESIDFLTLLEFASLLGLGTWVPVEVAQKALPLIEGIIAKLDKPQVALNDCAADEARQQRKATWTALAAALSGKGG